MTREEAKSCIGTIEMLQRLVYNIHGVMDAIDADNYKKIIKALEQEPTTKNDLGVDCISRKAALGACHNFAIGVLDDYYEKCLKQWIIDLPPITPIRPKGHWIGHREHCENLGVIPSGLGAYEWCSNCDCGIDVREWHRNHYNFCPNCGSDNREDNTDNDR